MEAIYWLVVKCYGLLIRLSSPFHPKAKLWIKGRQQLLSALKTKFDKDEKRIWFHCSSLGEFEQGKPVLDRLKKEYPDYKIVLTFFSPSGFELKKNDAVADAVLYLPLDGPRNSKHFIEKVKPSFAVFVKYEFWHFYIKYLKEKKIPCYVISATFRPSQIYFKWYGKFFYRILQRITHIFVQNQASLELLYKNALTNVTVSGDTRFDRVYIISSAPRNFPEVEKFVNGSPVLIAGSTWPDDEALIAEMINSAAKKWKYIIAPHEVSPQGIQQLRSKIGNGSVLYSSVKEMKASDRVLIIDSVGMLSSLYRYGTMAYVGGGFGSGIHNTLEPAAFGLPVLFGPNYQKFPEATAMIKHQTAFSVNTAKQLTGIAETFENEKALELVRSLNRKYIETNRGATDVFMNYLKLNIGIV